MNDDIRTRAIALYDAYTHEGRDRRAFMREMTLLVGSAAAASALVASIAASPAAAALSDPADPRLVTRKGGYGIDGGKRLTGFFAAPRQRSGKLPAVMVIHENRGLTPHIEDVARRLALAGFFVVAPDFLSDAGGTPTDEDKARGLIGALDLGITTADGLATIKRLKQLTNGNGKAGAVGFCWGGAFVDRLAVAAGPALDAGVSYYGPAPDPSEAVKVQAPLLLHYAGLDTRVAATGDPWVAALKAAGKPVAAWTYPNVNHAFNNDTSAERYDKAAATLAWDRTLAFFKEHLT